MTELEELGIGLNVGIQWEEALHAALMPVTPQCSMGSLAESEGGRERERGREEEREEGREEGRERMSKGWREGGSG